jgi:hypothetical protein
MATTAQRLAEYEDLYRKAQQYDPNKFQNEFEKSYGEATNYNKDLIEQQAQALGEVQAVAPTLREKYMNTLISDPTAQMALIAQARQAPIQSYGTAANLLTARGQRYQDILGKTLGGYQTSASQANTAAENAWRLYQDALQQDQFNQQMRASRGGGGGSSVLDILSALGMTGDQAQAAIPQGGGYVEDTPAKKVANWTDKAYSSDWLGADLTKAPTSIGGGILKAGQLLNPLTYIKTGAGLLGNLIGNRGTNKSFLDKLLDRR